MTMIETGPMRWATIRWTGRFSGYVAAFATPVVRPRDGLVSSAIQIPHSHDNYATFNKRARGRVTVGVHPSLSLSVGDALDHYSALPTLAVVRAHEDNFGIWVEGRIRLWGLIRHGFRQPNISPDWRTIDGNLELVALLAPKRAKPHKAKSYWAKP